MVIDPKTIDEMFARLDEADAREAERLVGEMVNLRVQMALAEQAQNGAKPRRSKLSALEKSRFIRAHGKARYDALPWS